MTEQATSGPSRTQWANAFVRQGRSDFDVYRKLSSDNELPICHHLHYLQMACEKVAKAYRLRDTRADIDTLLTRHVGLQKFISAFLLSPTISDEFADNRAQLQAIRRKARQLAGEVQRLAPAVDRQNNPSNSEYPWWSGRELVVPCDYSFPNLSLLNQPGGRMFLKLIRRALNDFESIEIS